MTASPSEAFFASARSKIKWAEQHMQEFHGAMLEFLGSGSYQASIKDEPQTQSRFYEIVQRKRLPDSIPCLVGDAVHNLRSALDHVAYEIVKRSGRVPSEGLYFPIKDTRPEVIGAIKTEIQVAAGTDLIALIADRIQPHRGGHRNGHTLWVLHRLDCIDKHRELLTAVEDIGFEHIEAVDGSFLRYDSTKSRCRILRRFSPCLPASERLSSRPLTKSRLLIAPLAPDLLVALESSEGGTVA